MIAPSGLMGMLEPPSHYPFWSRELEVVSVHAWKADTLGAQVALVGA